MATVCVLPTKKVKAVRAQIKERFKKDSPLQTRILSGFDYAIAGEKNEAAKKFVLVPINDLAEVIILCKKGGVNLFLTKP